MKIIEKSLGEIEDYLKAENEDVTYARFPTRFIVVDDLRTWQKVVKILKNLSNILIKLSDFCKNQDDFPDIMEIISKIRDLINQGKKVTFIPLHEIIRVHKNPELFNYFLFEIEPAKNARLYLLYYSIDKSFEMFINKQRDMGVRKLPPIKVSSHEYDERAEVKFFITNDKDLFDIIKFNCSSKLEVLDGFREYLKQIESGALNQRKFVIFSDILYNVEEIIDRDITLIKVKNHSELIKNVLGYQIPIIYFEDERKYWDNLLKELLNEKTEDYESFLRKSLNIFELDDSIFNRWGQLNDYERWLVYSWAKAKLTSETSYLTTILNISRDLNDFEEKIWNYPLDHEVSSQTILLERVDLIRKGLNNPPIGYFERLKGITNLKYKLRLLTGTNFYEKIEILLTIANLLESEHLTNEDLSFLKFIYPELFYYLNLPLTNTLASYVTNYIKAKIINSFTPLDNLNKEVTNFNIFSYPSRNSVLERYLCQQVWIDGMGIEWAGLVYHLLKGKGYEISLETARANLPTTTEFNSFPDGAVRFSNLDEIYHKQDRDYPDYIVEEIDTLSQIILEKVIPLVEIHGKIVLTSDHGSTRFAGWIEEKIDMENVEVFRNGRYVKYNEKILKYSELYYIEHYNDNVYLISKIHRNFKGGRKTKVENHGGATIEEALVPIFYVKKKLPYQIAPKIDILSKDILIIKPVIELECHPEVSNLQIKFGRFTVGGKKVTPHKWLFDLTNYKSYIKAGKQKVIIVSDFGEIEETINFRGGYVEEDLI